MADSPITGLPENTDPATTDIIVMVDDPAGSEVTQKITFTNVLKVINGLTEDSTPDVYADYLPTYDASASTPKKVLLGKVAPPLGEGVLRNGKISVSVATNDLSVSLKTIAGNDASTSEPIYCTIGGTQRTISAQLLNTLLDGTNWFNAGSSELATKAVDYFVYLCYVTASSAVAIGFSRIPYATTYADFSGTTTNEKYAPFTTGNDSSVTPASTDAVVNIGRFTATLSASAAYTWSISGTGNVINRPIFTTDWREWVPTLTGFSAAPTVTSYTYKIDYKTVHLVYREGTNGTSNATTFTATAPFTAVTRTNGLWFNFAFLNDNGGNELGFCYAQSASASITFARSPTATFTASGGKRANATILYEIG